MVLHVFPFFPCSFFPQIAVGMGTKMYVMNYDGELSRERLTGKG